MSEWKECTLEDIADIIPGFAFKSKHFSDNLGQSKVIKITDISPPYIDVSNAMYIDMSHYDHKKMQKYIISKGDFVVAMTGATIGKVGRMQGDKAAYINQRVATFRSKANTCADFVYYSISGSEFQGFIQNNIDSNSAQENISGTSIGRFPILLPPLPEQKAIAAVLSSLDDKIDLLHRQNKTLEAMAETLFRQWFVEEADAGWEKVPLSAFADNIKENVKVEALSDHEHYVGLENIPRKRVILDSWGKTDSLESNKSIFKINDILFGKLRSYFHKVVLSPIDGVCSTDILVIRPKKEEWLSFCLYWFFSSDVVEHSDLGSGGTRMPRTNWEIVAGYKVPRPTEELILEFDKVVRPSLKKMSCNIETIRTLENLRDTLLPKLMSGEVRVAL